MNLLAVHPLPLALASLLGLCAGLPIGLVHFATLRYDLRLFLRGRATLALGLLALRLTTTTLLLALLGRLGVGAILGGMAGLLLARQWVLRRLAPVPVNHPNQRNRR